MERKKYHYINDGVKIDFPVPAAISELMRECEEYDLEDSPAYDECADAIGIVCKNAYASGELTKEQWNMITRRYA